MESFIFRYFALFVLYPAQFISASLLGRFAFLPTVLAITTALTILLFGHDKVPLFSQNSIMLFLSLSSLRIKTRPEVLRGQTGSK